MRQKLFRIAAVLVLILAAAVFSYPYWSRWYAGQMQGVAIENYEDSVRVLTEEERQAVFQAALDYNRELASGVLSDEYGLVFDDVFTPGGARPPRYGEMLVIPGADDVMATVEIPSLGLRLPVYHGVEESSLHRGAGHLPQTALPVGGEGTHCVIAGHRGLPGALLFTDLGRAEVGDVFWLRVLDRVQAYEIHNIRVVEPDDVSALAPVAGQDLATLATCTPLGVNSHRLLLMGHRVPYEPLAPVWPDPITSQLLVAVGIVLVLLLALNWMRRQWKKHKA